MKTNEQLQKDVQDAIKWEPLLNAAEIGVTAKDGVITLTGVVDSYAKLLEVEDATKNVVGVKAVVEKIEIKFGTTFQKDDNEIAIAVINAFDWNWAVPKDRIKIKVENGWVTLEGEVRWHYQKEAAKKSVNNLLGVKGVKNIIKIKFETLDTIEKQDIERAILRNWSLGDKNIVVKVADNKVTLIGNVHSLYQKEAAERIAWNSPGVLIVDNELIVEYLL